MSENGQVWIAGAGPGDAALISRKVMQLFGICDVVVYDALVSAEILSLIPQDTEKIDAGKRADKHTKEQEEINHLLVELALAGKRVLRLKGGDPFLFGRGAEEAEALKNADIEYEIVSGITSAIAVPAYAGIPVTHRDYVSSLHIITGQLKKNGEDATDYKSIVKLKGTLLFLMAVANLETICERLIAAGMRKDMPAAVVEKGTLASQRKVISDISNIAKETRANQIKPPAILVVGEVCTLSETLEWNHKKPLSRKQVLVTRPQSGDSILAEKLRQQGARVIEFPTIKTKTILPNTEFEKAMQQFGRFEKEWIVFTSAVGVEAFFENLKQRQEDIRTIIGKSPKVQFAVVGQTTKNALEQRGMIADCMPKKYAAKYLGETLAAVSDEDTGIYLFRAKEASGEILKELEKHKIAFYDIALYETKSTVDKALQEKVKELLQNKEIDCITVTSTSCVKGFVSSFDKELYKEVPALCIGTSTREEAEKCNWAHITAKEATLDSMVEALIQTGGKDK